MSAHWFRCLSEFGVLAIGCWKLDGTISDGNDALVDLIGYSRAELRSGQIRWSAITPPEFAPLDEQAVIEVQQKGYCEPFEKEYINKDGRRIPVLVRGAAFGKGKVDSGAFIVIDLSQRQKPGGAKTEFSSAIQGLSDRQRLICLLLSYGEPERRIARRLDLGLRTIELEKHRVAQQLKLPTGKVTIWAVENRWALLAELGLKQAYSK
jgi:PAS domain S-box-containing protein